MASLGKLRRNVEQEMKCQRATTWKKGNRDENARFYHLVLAIGAVASRWNNLPLLAFSDLAVFEAIEKRFIQNPSTWIRKWSI